MSTQPQAPFRAPTETQAVDPKTGFLTKDWIIHEQIGAQQLKTPANQKPPATSAQLGQFGQIALDANFLYVHNGLKWRRIALTDF